jgi:4-hydroxy-3-methylbut-2-en-1-yl diphosphate reductase
VHLYAQTTMDPQGFEMIGQKIKAFIERHHSGNAPEVFVHNTICRQVSNRINHLEEFSASHDVILFVSGKESSNGRFLFEICRKANPKSYHIEDVGDIDKAWFSNAETAGISGATSTPLWQMNKIAEYIHRMDQKSF